MLPDNVENLNPYELNKVLKSILYKAQSENVVPDSGVKSFFQPAPNSGWSSSESGVEELPPLENVGSVKENLGKNILRKGLQAGKGMALAAAMRNPIGMAAVILDQILGLTTGHSLSEGASSLIEKVTGLPFEAKSGTDHLFGLAGMLSPIKPTFKRNNVVQENTAMRKFDKAKKGSTYGSQTIEKMGNMVKEDLERNISSKLQDHDFYRKYGSLEKGGSQLDQGFANLRYKVNTSPGGLNVLEVSENLVNPLKKVSRNLSQSLGKVPAANTPTYDKIKTLEKFIHEVETHGSQNLTPSHLLKMYREVNTQYPKASAGERAAFKVIKRELEKNLNQLLPESLGEEFRSLNKDYTDFQKLSNVASYKNNLTSRGLQELTKETPRGLKYQTRLQEAYGKDQAQAILNDLRHGSNRLERVESFKARKDLSPSDYVKLTNLPLTVPTGIYNKIRDSRALTALKGKTQFAVQVNPLLQKETIQTLWNRWGKKHFKSVAEFVRWMKTTQS